MDGRIVAITCTRDRPIAARLSQQMMDEQTHLPLHFLSTQDLPVALHLSHAIRTMLDRGIGDYFLVCEDDDWYPPTYVQDRLRELQEHEFVGSERTRYYHLPSRAYFEHAHPKRSSGAAMGFNRDVAKVLADLLAKGRKFPDIEMSKAAPLWLNPDPTYVGMKGLPGLVGVGSGHRAEFYSTRRNARVDDAQYGKLREWVGNRWADIYAGVAAAEGGDPCSS